VHITGPVRLFSPEIQGEAGAPVTGVNVFGRKAAGLHFSKRTLAYSEAHDVGTQQLTDGLPISVLGFDKNGRDLHHATVGVFYEDDSIGADFLTESPFPLHSPQRLHVAHCESSFVSNSSIRPTNRRRATLLVHGYNREGLSRSCHSDTNGTEHSAEAQATSEKVRESCG
jgi:hypothetical protein